MAQRNTSLALKLLRPLCFSARLFYLLTRTPVCKYYEYCPLGVTGRAFRGVVYLGLTIP